MKQIEFAKINGKEKELYIQSALDKTENTIK